MALVSKNIPNLINGVSQQPPALRLESQGELQENGFSDVVDGLKKRPATEFLKKLVKYKEGEELVTNGEFSDGTTNNWTIVGGANISATVTGDKHLSLAVTTGDNYAKQILSETVTSKALFGKVILISGTATIDVGGANGYSGELTEGTNYFLVPSGRANNILKLIPTENSTALFDDVSFLEGDLTEDLTEALTESELEDAFFHSYKRSEDEQYTIVVIGQGTDGATILVYDVEGNLRYQQRKGSWKADGTPIISNQDTNTYIQYDTDLTATSVADATFLVNKKRKVVLSDIINPTQTRHQALVYLKSVNYGRHYKIKVISKSEVKDDGTPQTFEGQVLVDPSDSGTSGNMEGAWNPSSLRVDSVIGDLRSELESAGFVSDHAQVDTHMPLYNLPSTSEEHRTLVSVLVGSVSAIAGNTVTVRVNGVYIPYDAEGHIGFKIGDNNIILPSFALQQVGTGNYTRPYTIVKQYDDSAITGYQEPMEHDKEPFFVMVSDPNGGMKDFNIEATDSDGGVNLRAFKDTCKSFTALPNQCIEGFTIGVVGDNNKHEDDFHVVFTGHTGSGYWKETVAPNLLNYYALGTMPHTLRQNDDLSFTFSEGTWNERKAGDDLTNPAPSFVGKHITDIFFHRNRLGILADENIVFSEASEYFNFWRTTVRALLDSDPIDVAVSQNEVSLLQAAVPIQDNLLLFSEINQFTLSASQLLTPSEVSIDQATKYECDLTATPVNAGNSVFFATKSGAFAGIREYHTKADTPIQDAVSITSHIPEYIQGSVRHMAASSNEATLLCLTTTNKKECYVYKWYDSAKERLQSSWSKWVFKREILSVTFNNADIYFLFADGSYEKMDLAASYTEHLLDSRITLKAPELVTNGAFTSSVEDWNVADGTLYHYFSTAKLQENGNDPVYSYQGITTVIGETYRLTGNIYNGTCDGAISVSTTSAPSGVIATSPTATGDASVDFEFTAVGTTTYVLLEAKNSPTSGQYLTFDNISVRSAIATGYAAGASDGKVCVTEEGLSAGAYNNDALTTQQADYLDLNKKLTIGDPYSFKYGISQQVFKPSQGDTTKLARFQLRKMSFNCNNTGHFDVTVESVGRSTVTSHYTGRVLGTLDNLLDASSIIDNDSFSVGIRAEADKTAITITNDTHLPCTFQSAEWEGYIVIRNKRI